MPTSELYRPAEYLDNVLTIKQFFVRHRHGGYIFAVTNSFPLKKEINLEAIEYCKEKGLAIGETTFSLEAKEDLVQQLQKAKEKFRDGLILVNIDELMLATKSEFAYRINQIREALLALHIPILIWLTPESHNAFIHKAIDLYTRRELDTVFFPDLKAEDTNHLLERSEMRLGQKEDPETLRTRIALLEKQLETARKDDVPRSRVAKEIVLPLINAYRQLLLLREAKNLLEEFKNDFANNDRNALIEFGRLCRQCIDLDVALDYFEKALNIDIKNFGEESDNVGFDYNAIGLIWSNKGNYDKAIQFYEKALAINIKLFSEKDMRAATCYNNLGEAWRKSGNYDKAIDYFEKALAFNLKVAGEESLDVAAYYNNLGLAWKDKGNIDKAIDYFEKALAIVLKLFGEESPYSAITFSNLGTARSKKGDFNKAILYYEKALAINLKLFGEQNPNVAIEYINLGMIWNRKGDLKKAETYLQKAYTIYCNTYGPEHYLTERVKKRIDELTKKS